MADDSSQERNETQVPIQYSSRNIDNYSGDSVRQDKFTPLPHDHIGRSDTDSYKSNLNASRDVPSVNETANTYDSGAAVYSNYSSHEPDQRQNNAYIPQTKYVDNYRNAQEVQYYGHSSSEDRRGVNDHVPYAEKTGSYHHVPTEDRGRSYGSFPREKQVVHNDELPVDKQQSYYRTYPEDRAVNYNEAPPDITMESANYENRPGTNDYQENCDSNPPELKSEEDYSNQREMQPNTMEEKMVIDEKIPETRSDSNNMPLNGTVEHAETIQREDKIDVDSEAKSEEKFRSEAVESNGKDDGSDDVETSLQSEKDNTNQNAEYSPTNESDAVQPSEATLKNTPEILSVSVVEVRKEDSALDDDLQNLRRAVELKYANFDGDSEANIDNNESEMDTNVQPEQVKEPEAEAIEIGDSGVSQKIDDDEADKTDSKSDIEFKEEPEPESPIRPRGRSSRKAARKALRQISDYIDEESYSDGLTGPARPEKSRSCKCCDSVFTTHEEYSHHVVMYFGIASPPTIMYKCQSCCHCFDSLVDLKIHARAHMEGAPVLCMICDQPFKDRAELALHLASHNCDGDINQSPNAFDSDNTIDDHDNFDSSITPLESFDFPKEISGDVKVEPKAEFEVPDNDEIEKMKLSRGRYKCTWCSKVYKGKSGLKNHLRFCSKDQPALKCRFCGKVFKEESNWKRHEAMHLGIRPHKCTLCDKAYSQKKHLKAHMTTHSGVRGQYACDQCEKSFSDNHGLRRHKMRHTDERPYPCTRCERRFREPSDLRMHEKYHDNIRPHVCPEENCGKAYVKKSHLRQHMKVHSGEKNYVCIYCDKSYHSLQSCRRHEMIHTGEKPYQCQYCDKAYSEASDRNYHELTHTGERPHVCTLCDKKFIRKSHLNAHMASHRGERNYSCEKCGKRFTSIYGLRKHGQIHDGVKKYSCEYCGKMFRESRNLKVHLMTHTGEKPHGCSECDKRFITAGELKMHFRIHTGEKPNTCEYCGMVFSQKGNLTRHILRHTGDRPLKCEECGKGFIERQELKAHILNHAGMKPYKCEHCNLGFVRKHHLTKHYRTHTGVKPHCCEFCGKSFTERYNLQTHRVIHTGVKPHPCPFCPQGFIRKGHLKKHVRESHPGKELEDTPNFFVARAPNKYHKEPISFSQEDILKMLPMKQLLAKETAGFNHSQDEPKPSPVKQFPTNELSNSYMSHSQVSSPGGERNDSQSQKEGEMDNSYQEPPFRRPPYLPEIDLGHAYPQLHPSMMQQYGAPANMLPMSTPEQLLNRLNEMHNNPGAYPHPNVFPL